LQFPVKIRDLLHHGFFLFLKERHLLIMFLAPTVNVQIK